MLSWLEIIRRKPESTRRAIALMLFIFLGALIVTIWLWNIQGSFPYANLDTTRQSFGETFRAGIQDFQDLRLKLGELKQKLLDAVSGVQAPAQLEKAE